MWFSIHNETVKLSIYAKPNAKQTALVNIDEHGLHITLHAKAAKGEANEELISFLAKLFRVPKSKISLKRGMASKHKLVLLPLTDMLRKYLDNPEHFISNLS